MMGTRGWCHVMLGGQVRSEVERHEKIDGSKVRYIQCEKRKRNGVPRGKRGRRLRSV